MSAILHPKRILSNSDIEGLREVLYMYFSIECGCHDCEDVINSLIYVARCYEDK